MLNQDVSINEGQCPGAQNTSLPARLADAPCWSVAPSLAVRLTRAAAASGHPAPKIISSGVVLLLPLHLPFNSRRKRIAALPFAFEPHLAAPMDKTFFALGPNLAEHTYLCAAADRSVLADWIRNAPQQGAALPDVLAVPTPSLDADWCLWCAEQLTYIRCTDGSGFCVSKEALADLWRAQNQPRIELAYGSAPPGVVVTSRRSHPPDPEPAAFELDMTIAQTGTGLENKWWARAVFVAVVAFFALFSHAIILHLDSRALAALSAAHSAELNRELSERGLALDLRLPSSSLAQTLQELTAPQASADPFLFLLAQVASALPAAETSLRDLRFDGSAGTLTLLISGTDLSALQRAEAAIESNGLAVSSGSASQTPGGAELQLTVSRRN